MKFFKGFSLIELMIVVTIIGILAAVAIPSYKNYVIRAKVVDIISSGRALQLALTENIMFNNTVKITDPQKRFPEVLNPMPYVKKMVVIGDSVILFEVNMTALGLAGGGVDIIQLVPTLSSNGVTWKCLGPPPQASSELTNDFLPKSCQ